MMNTHAAKFIVFNTLLNSRDLRTPAASSIIMRIVIRKARKSGGRPEKERSMKAD
jgi:hypothetical protein